MKSRSLTHLFTQSASHSVSQVQTFRLTDGRTDTSVSLLTFNVVHSRAYKRPIQNRMLWLGAVAVQQTTGQHSRAYFLPAGTPSGNQAQGAWRPHVCPYQ